MSMRIQSVLIGTSASQPNHVEGDPDIYAFLLGGMVEVLPVHESYGALDARLSRHGCHPSKREPRPRPCGMSDGEQINLHLGGDHRELHQGPHPLALVLYVPAFR